MDGSSWRSSSTSGAQTGGASSTRQSTSSSNRKHTFSSPASSTSSSNPSSRGKSTNQSGNSFKQSTNHTTPPSFQPTIGQEYYGKIATVITNSNRIGMYCKFGEQSNQWYPKDGFIRNIIYNPAGQLYRQGDEVMVRCISTNPIFLCLLPTYVRPLLILDINGPLGNRTPYEKVEGKNSKRSFVTRKFTSEFLEICSQYYEIAVWSCAKKNNIELELFSNINLFFIWSQEESTSLYPRTSFVSPAKPLFLKELSKVFDKFPCYNYSNTVLLENHLEKFERNKFGSGIICPDFDTTKVDEDEVLHPDGELTRHLVAMATQQPINILEYIISQTGSSPLFPTTYPIPPESSLIPSDTVPSIEEQPKPLENIITYSDKELLWNYLLWTCNRNENVAQKCLDQISLPGPKATPFRFSHISQISQDPDNYVVCEKTDGDRAILVISPEHHEIYFVYRNHKIEKLKISQEKKDDVLNWYNTHHGITVFDGELVSEYLSPQGDQNDTSPSTSTSSTRAAFLCFDTVYLNGQLIGIQSNLTLLDRLNLANQWFTENSTYLNDLHIQEHETIRSSSPLVIQCKNMNRVRDIEEISMKLIPHSSHGWIYNDESFPHLSDGLVFSPIRPSYYDYMAIKWKPIELCTNDYWISIIDLKKIVNSTSKELQVTGYLPLSTKQTSSTSSTASANNSAPRTLPLSQISLTKDQVKDILSRHQTSSITGAHIIAECSYDKLCSVWKVYKIRYDKSTPNTLQTAWNNLEVISEGLNLSTLVSAFQQLKNQMNEIHDNPSSIERIDHHYNQIQHLRHTGSRDIRIAMHRKVMNWSKACLLQQCLQPVSFTLPSSVDEYTATIQSSLALFDSEQQKQKDQVPNFLKAHKGGNQFRQKNKKSTINVVDVACGRGGDIKKFTSESTVGSYLGIDISEEQIKECIQRANENQFIKSSNFYHGDAGDGQWYLQLPPPASSSPSSSHQSHYDIAWCMFAFHYFCDQEIHCRHFFTSISYLLKRNGIFTLTFPNPYLIYKRLTSSSTSSSSTTSSPSSNEKEKEKEEDEEPICSIRYSSTQFPYSLNDCLTQFGLEYSFTLGDAVQDCPEYIVPLHQILIIAQEYGFYILQREQSPISLISMNQWIEDYCLQNSNYLNLRAPMQVCGPRSPGRNVSSEEWDAISLYVCLTFIKASE